MVANVNAASLHNSALNWQPRLNQEDSTQFDPGIMDTSISPASYSLSPQQYLPHQQYQCSYQNQPVYQFQNDIQFDLESLLVNASISDNTQPSSTSSTSFANPMNEDDNCSNQINPSFLFKTDMDLNNNTFVQHQLKPMRKLHHQLNTHKHRSIMKIEEELDSDLQFLNTGISNAANNIACSLPSNSEFQNLESQRSDPVLTQLILNQNHQIPDSNYQYNNNFNINYQEHVYSSSLPANYLNFKRSNSPLLETPPNKRPSSTNLDQIVVKTELIDPVEDDKFSKLKLSSPIIFEDNINDFFLDQQSDIFKFKIEDEESEEDDSDETEDESEDVSDYEEENMKRSKSDKINKKETAQHLINNNTDSLFSNQRLEPFSSSYQSTFQPPIISSSLPVNKTVKKLLNKKAKRQLQSKRSKKESDDEDSDFSDSDSNDSKKKTLQSAPGSYINSESLFDLMMSKNRDAYFWQYNIQSKGPKTKKVLTLRNKDPHLHRDFYDPVFQLQSLNSKNGTSLNKLRKGDGNDVTPNAEKLYNLGNQIKDFIHKSYQINNLVPTNSGINLNSSYDGERVNLKREKNKIASRACRLKKKAQHEANKIKLFGLNEEHSESIFI